MVVVRLKIFAIVHSSNILKNWDSHFFWMGRALGILFSRHVSVVALIHAQIFVTSAIMRSQILKLRSNSHHILVEYLHAEIFIFSTACQIFFISFFYKNDPKPIMVVLPL